MEKSNMEKKTKKELLVILEEQNKNLKLYKSRLHDTIGSYKNLLAEKETLQNSIKALTEISNVKVSGEEKEETEPLEQQNEQCIQNLKINFGALTQEKSRIESELKADRKKILQQKEEIEKKLICEENKWFLEKQSFENQISELKKKVTNQQKEREKEQHDHVLMLKELQNILANERATKERLEHQMSELQTKVNGKQLDKKIIAYEEKLDELNCQMKISQDQLNIANDNVKKKNAMLCDIQEEIEKIKILYQNKIDDEKKQANVISEKLEALLFEKEKRISSLENRIFEMSSLVGNHDKIKQEDQATIQKLKARITQLQIECSSFSHLSTDDSKLWYKEPCDGASETINLTNDTERMPLRKWTKENIHVHCQAEIAQIKSELEEYKIKCESALKERYNKTSAALLSDAKAGKEIKELKSRINDLETQLHSCKSQLKLNEEYHSKITSNLEKACEDLKLLNKQELAQIQTTHKTHLLEFEHQIQKQRERTLLLLDEKDKEIAQLKSYFLSSFNNEVQTEGGSSTDENILPIQTDTTTKFLSHSLIASKKDGHILHYMQEISRKDMEITNLRQSRIQLESTNRKLQQTLCGLKQKYFDEMDDLKSRIKLLESTQDVEGTNVEYLKNVVLRFLKCTDRRSRKHMINAIATVLHFTKSEIQDVSCI